MIPNEYVDQLEPPFNGEIALMEVHPLVGTVVLARESIQSRLNGIPCLLMANLCGSSSALPKTNPSV